MGQLSKSSAVGRGELGPYKSPLFLKQKQRPGEKDRARGGPQTSPNKGEGELQPGEGDRVYFWAFALKDRQEAAQNEGCESPVQLGLGLAGGRAFWKPLRNPMSMPGPEENPPFPVKSHSR